MVRHFVGILASKAKLESPYVCFWFFFMMRFLCLFYLQRGKYDNPRWLSPDSILLLNQMLQVHNQ